MTDTFHRKDSVAMKYTSVSKWEDHGEWAGGFQKTRAAHRQPLPVTRAACWLWLVSPTGSLRGQTCRRPAAQEGCHPDCPRSPLSLTCFCIPDIRRTAPSNNQERKTAEKNQLLQVLLIWALTVGVFLFKHGRRRAERDPQTHVSASQTLPFD